MDGRQAAGGGRLFHPKWVVIWVVAQSGEETKKGKEAQRQWATARSNGHCPA